jgi:hypothetical protein
VTDEPRSARSLVEELERLADELPEDPALEELELYVESRKEVAKALTRLNPTGLSSEEKRELGGRVQAVLSRDQALVTALFAVKDELAARIAALPAARRTVKGYASAATGSRMLRTTA